MNKLQKGKEKKIFISVITMKIEYTESEINYSKLFSNIQTLFRPLICY